MKSNVQALSEHEHMRFVSQADFVMALYEISAHGVPLLAVSPWLWARGGAVICMGKAR
ncbi:hypothetical protein [Hydrogenophaga crassostreae]|uniref:hypothetical protein n=1 Tax=Hydrogenophaga crassostreae TaxID=1763535 RepID=UPI0012F7BF1F|nr:hypothetical protein [Hydrogenophaga crassostreae]